MEHDRREPGSDSAGSQPAPDILVPPPDAPWKWTIVHFALTWNGYDRFEPSDRLGPTANEAVETWMRSGALPHDLGLLRSLLFFEQRRWRHLEADPKGEHLAYIRAVMGLIRSLSGGRVPGPPDPLP